MNHKLLYLLSMEKYERLLPRVFAGVSILEIRDLQGDIFWSWNPSTGADQKGGNEPDEAPEVEWSYLGEGIDQRRLLDGCRQFRANLVVRGYGSVAWFVATYETRHSTSITSAEETMRHALADTSVFLQEELELQLECNQLAVELTERAEELGQLYLPPD